MARVFRSIPIACLGTFVIGLLSTGILAEENRDVAEGEEAAFVSWMKDSAVGLDVESWFKTELADFTALDKAIEGKRIVYLGEGDHWIREKYDYRLLFIRHLFKKGWRRIGMEMGYSDGKRIDAYLETGDPAFLERVALYGYKGDLRKDRDDRPRGFAGMDNPTFRKVFWNEERRFLAELRKLNESIQPGQQRIEWFGFDVDFFPGGGQVDALRLLEDRSSEPAVAEIQQRLKRVQGESRIEEAQRIQSLLGFIAIRESQLKDNLGIARLRDLKCTLRCLAESLLFSDAAKNGPTTVEWMHGLIKREEAMYRFMDDFLGGLSARDKVILMGHNLHFSKNSEKILLGPIGIPAPAMWQSIGTYLSRKMPTEIYAIWMTYDHGRHASILLPEVVEEVQSHQGSLEYYLAKAGSVYFLPLNTDDERAAFLRRQMNFKQNGSLASGEPASQADAIFFVKEVSEPRACPSSAKMRHASQRTR